MRICAVENKVRAQLAAGILSQQGIPCQIVPLETHMLSGFWRKDFVWGYIEVPGEYAEAAKRICADLLEDRD
jgi:hypothetical protein